jgi:hypothetical protein
MYTARSAGGGLSGVQRAVRGVRPAHGQRAVRHRKMHVFCDFLRNCARCEGACGPLSLRRPFCRNYAGGVALRGQCYAGAVELRGQCPVLIRDGMRIHHNDVLIF